MSDEREFKLKITGDASSLVSASQQASGALGETSKATTKGAEAGELMHKNHRALHLVLNQVGQASQGLQVGLTLLSGVMMGSLLFAVRAVAEGIGMLREHFKNVAEQAAETAKATVEMWEAQRNRSRSAGDAMEAYSAKLKKIYTDTNALKAAEDLEKATLDATLEARKKIVEEMENQELAAAKGDKVREAEIKARYGEKKSRGDLADESAKLQLEKRNLGQEEEKEAEAKKKADEARDTRKAGPMFAADADKATHDLPELRKAAADAELALKAASVAANGKTPEELRSEAAGFGPDVEVEYERRARNIEEATKKQEETAQALDRANAAIHGFEVDTKRLADAEAAAVADLEAAHKAVETRKGGIATKQEVYDIHRGTAETLTGMTKSAELTAAGVKPGSVVGGTLVDVIKAEEGRSRGEKMSEHDAALVRKVVAAMKLSKSQGGGGLSDAQAAAIVKELMDVTIPMSQKLTDALRAIGQLKQQMRGTFNP